MGNCSRGSRDAPVLALVTLFSLIVVSWQQQQQLGDWAWVGGDSAIAAAGVYGTKGVPSTTNRPPARTLFASWYLPNAREYWLFGGRADPVQNNVGRNDLWRYRLDDNTWTWIFGSNTTNAMSVTGTKGVPSPGNSPGARFGSTAFLVNENEFWLLAGRGTSSGGFAPLGDLWRYRIDENTWTFMAGTTQSAVTGVYGTRGTPSVNNYPPCRMYSVGWYDASTDDLWIYGGIAEATDGNGFNEEMWRYRISDNTWTWMLGANTRGGPPVYGTRGIPSPTNTPGARSAHSGWFVPDSREFWVFAGERNPGTLTDLWRFTISNLTWTWMSGSQVLASYGTYGPAGVFNSTYFPGARFSSSIWYDQVNREAWVYGGTGRTQSPQLDGDISETWRYRLSDNTWAFMGGSTVVNSIAVFGTFGVRNPSSRPGSSRAGGIFFDDSSSSLFVVGGEGYNDTQRGLLNSVWSVILPDRPPSVPPPPRAPPEIPSAFMLRIVLTSMSATKLNSTAVCQGFSLYLALSASDVTCFAERPSGSNSTTEQYMLLAMVTQPARNVFSRLSTNSTSQAELLSTISTTTSGIFSGAGIDFRPSVAAVCIFPAPGNAVCDTTRGIWIIEGTVSSSIDAPFTAITPIEVRGDFVSGPDSTVTLSYQSVSLTITGCAKFDGNLILAGPPLVVSANVTFLLATFASVCPSSGDGSTSTFATVNWQNPPQPERPCQTVSTDARYSPTTLSVVLGLDSSRCSPSDEAVAVLGTGATIGIVVAVVAVTAIVVAAVVLYRKFWKPNPALEQAELALVDDSPDNTKATGTDHGPVSNPTAGGATKKGNKKRKDETEYSAINIDEFNAQREASAQIVSIPASDVKMLQRLGNGAYGDVWLGSMPDGAFVAVKRMKNGVLAHAAAFFAEASIMMQLTDNPHVVQMYGVIADGGEYGLVMEFMPGGSLETYLKQLQSKQPDLSVGSKSRGLLVRTDSRLYDLVYCIASGLLCLASNGIVHRDLSARNVLLDETKTFAKVSDFGLSRKLDDPGSKGKTVSNIGPIRWMSPENIRDKIYSQKSDVWSFGCTLIELVTGEVPYFSFSGGLAELAISIRDDGITPLDYLDQDLEIHKVECTKWCHDLLKRCFAADPDDRPSFEEILDSLKTSRQDLYVSLMNRLDNREAILHQLATNASSSDSMLTPIPTTSSHPHDAPKEKASKRGSAKLRGSVRLNRDVLGAKPIDSPVHLLCRLGEGSFGAVFLASLGGSYIAVKQLSLSEDSSHLNSNERAKAEGLIYAEAAIMAKLKQNRNVISIYGLAVEGNKMSILMEFAARGSLETFVRKNKGKIPDTLLFRWAIGIARGMAGLAAQKIVHRDLAARNVLLDSTLEPKISDFGLSRDIEAGETAGKTTSNIGPIRWMPAESLKQIYSEKSDVWAYGCVLVEILSGEIPFGDIDLPDVVVGVRDKNWTPLHILSNTQAAKCDLSWMSSAPSYLIALAQMCFQNDALNRPTFDNIIEYLEQNIPNHVAKMEARREKERKKRVKLLEALDQIVV